MFVCLSAFGPPNREISEDELLLRTAHLQVRSRPTVAHLSKEVLPLGARLAPRVASGFASFADADVTALDGPCDRAHALDPSIAAAVGQAEKSAVCGALGRQAVSQP